MPPLTPGSPVQASRAAAAPRTHEPRKDGDPEGVRIPGRCRLLGRTHVIALVEHRATHGQPGARMKCAPVNPPERDLCEASSTLSLEALCDKDVPCAANSYDEVGRLMNDASGWPFRDVAGSGMQQDAKLEGFGKAVLQPNETRTVEAPVGPATHTWQVDETDGVEPGDFDSSAGAPCRDTDLEKRPTYGDPLTPPE